MYGHISSSQVALQISLAYGAPWYPNGYSACDMLLPLQPGTFLARCVMADSLSTVRKKAKIPQTFFFQRFYIDHSKFLCYLEFCV